MAFEGRPLRDVEVFCGSDRPLSVLAAGKQPLATKQVKASETMKALDKGLTAKEGDSENHF